MSKESQETPVSLTQANSDEKSVYEAGFHVVPTVPENEVAGVVERIRAMIEKAGGAVISEGFPKKIKFAYTIERSVTGKREKYAEGYFGWIKFDAPAGFAKTLEEAFLADRDVLRSIVIHSTIEEVAVPQSIFSSNALAGEVIQPKPVVAPAVHTDVSDEEINKTIDSLVS